jgi:hypothetical protein
MEVVRFDFLSSDMIQPTHRPNKKTTNAGSEGTQDQHRTVEAFEDQTWTLAQDKPRKSPQSPSLAVLQLATHTHVISYHDISRVQQVVPCLARAHDAAARRPTEGIQLFVMWLSYIRFPEIFEYPSDTIPELQYTHTMAHTTPSPAHIQLVLPVRSTLPTRGHTFVKSAAWHAVLWPMYRHDTSAVSPESRTCTTPGNYVILGDTSNIPVNICHETLRDTPVDWQCQDVLTPTYYKPSRLSARKLLADARL